MIEMPRFEKIKHQEDDRDDAVVDAIPEKRVGCRREKFEIPAEENECRDVPAHDEYANRDSDNSKTDWIYISKVLRSQVERIGTEIFHKDAIDCAEQNKPEHEQDLVSSKMKKDQLHRQRVIETT